MRLPSIDHLRERALATLLRFPLVLLSAVVGTSVLIARGDHNTGALAAALGLPLLMGVELLGERRGWSTSVRLAVGGACIPLLVLYYIFLPSEPTEGDIIRFLMLDVGLHLFVAFAPFIGRSGERGFWQFNQTLFIGIATALLYSATLTIGLNLALLSIDRLFDVSVPDYLYGDVTAVVFGIFNTWFFLGLVPADFEELETTDRYPKGLKVFAQYVLLPLVTVYLGILYVYGAKIVLEWEWPHGWVSALVLGYGVAGMLSLLLLHPLRQVEGNRWITIFSRWFYAALIPLIALLIPAVWKRISTYGVTEERYIVAALGFWLAGVCAYFLASRRRSIKVVPISLCILALAACYGPWSARSVSVASQRARLERALSQAGMLPGGRRQPAPDTLDYETRSSIQSMIYYMAGRGELNSVKGFGNVATERSDTWKLINELKLEGGYSPGSIEQFEVRPSSVVSLDGYSYWIDMMYDMSGEIHPAGSWVTDGHRMELIVDPRRLAARIVIDGDAIPLRLDSLIRTQVIGKPSTYVSDDTPALPDTTPAPLVVTGQGRTWKARLMVQRLGARRDGDEIELTAMRGRLLVGRRDAVDAPADTAAGHR